MMSVSKNTTVDTVCGICNACCGMQLQMLGNELVGVKGIKEHPSSKGFLCPKGKAMVELFHSPERLRYPLKKSADNEWQKISWPEALQLISDKLTIIKDNSGPEAVAIHIGQAGVKKQFTPYAELFARLFGTPNFSTAGSHCHLSRAMASTCTFGFHPQPDLANSHCIVLWGSNPTISNPPALDLIKTSRQNGGKLVVIDPRTTLLAKQADLHLKVRPGTDLALALGFIYIIINNQLYDREFVEEWTLGLSQVAETVRDFNPEKVQSITGIPSGQIEQAARIYANSASACIAHGNAMELHKNGFQAARAISILQSITGNLDVKGGELCIPPFLPPLTVKESKSIIPAIGQKEYPLFYQFCGNAQANLFSDAILSSQPYKIEAMIIMGSNPLLTWPNAGKLEKSLSELDFLVVMDQFMTATAQMADLVLPAATPLGSYELWEDFDSDGQLLIGTTTPVEEANECRSNWWLWNNLADRMGFSAHYPWADEAEAISARLNHKGLSLEQVKKHPNGYVYGHWQEKKYLVNGFATPSGKAELYCNDLYKYGYDPVPVYIPSLVSSATNPQNTGDYPVTLSSGARTREYMHSRYHNLESLRKLCSEPLLDINPVTAAELHITEGELVKVESDRGQLEIRIQYRSELEPGTVFMPHGWDEANANLLTDNDSLDPVTGFPADRALQVRISKIPS